MKDFRDTKAWGCYMKPADKLLDIAERTPSPIDLWWRANAGVWNFKVHKDHINRLDRYDPNDPGYAEDIREFHEHLSEFNAYILTNQLEWALLNVAFWLKTWPLVFAAIVYALAPFWIPLVGLGWYIASHLTVSWQ